MVWTAERGTVIKTVHDTRRIGNNLTDMLARARAGAPVPFVEPELTECFTENNASRVLLGITREKPGQKGTPPRLRVKEIYEVGHVYNVRKDIDGCLESRFLHELIVETFRTAVRYLDLKRSEAHRLQFIIEDKLNGQTGIMPPQLSFELLGERMPELP